MTQKKPAFNFKAQSVDERLHDRMIHMEIALHEAMTALAGIERDIGRIKTIMASRASE